MSSSEECEPTPGPSGGGWKRKKGVRNPDKYKKVANSQARLAGKEYTTQKGKAVGAKVIGPPCSCKLKCFQAISKEERESIFAKINSIESKNLQDLYLQSLIEVHQVERRRPRTQAAKQRAVSCKYFVHCGSTRKAVCLKAFLSLHAVSEKRVRRLRGLLECGETPKDRRGHASRPTFEIRATELNRMDDHIKSFPTKTSHYSSQEKTYLDARLNVKVMYDMFVAKFPDTRVKYEYFLRYFHQNYGYSFGRPQVDTCIQCEELSIKVRSKDLNDAAKRAAAAELFVHKCRAKKFHTKMRQVEDLCKENPDVRAVCFDYMQNIPLPEIPVQEIFYLRQLWVFVFGIHELGTNRVKMFTYHEGVARKGANDVCSMLLSYISELPPNVKELHLFSDGCTGQNRNHTVVRLLLTLALQKRFDKIYQYFPERGHSFLPCDRDFALIKKKVRRQDRIYTPEEYQAIVLAARKEAFEVEAVSTSDIFDVAAWWPQYYKKTCRSLEKQRPGQRRDDDSFSVTSNRMYVYDSKNPGIVQAYERIDGLMIRNYKLLKVTTLPTEINFPKAYTEEVPINDKKIEDIKKILKYIPEEHRPFYDKIVSWKTTVADSDD